MSDKKRNIRKEIRELDLGGSAKFPTDRRDYVLSVRSQLQLSNGRKYSSKTEDDEVVITRIF